MARVDFVETACFFAFATEQLDDGHSGEAFLDKRIEGCNLIANVGEGAFNAALKPARGHKQNRNHRQTHRDHSGIKEQKHGNEHHRNLEQVAKNHQQALGKDVCHGLDVAHRARHQLPDRGTVKKRSLKLEELPKELNPNVPNHLLTQLVGCEYKKPGSEALKHQSEHQTCDRPVHHGGIALLDRKIHCPLNEIGPQGCNPAEYHTQAGGRPQQGPVRTRVPKHAAQYGPVKGLSANAW